MMEDKLHESLNSTEPKGYGQSVIQMGSRDWWQRVVEYGILPANRIPLKTPTDESLAENPLIRAICERAEPIVWASHQEGYENLLKWLDCI